MTTIVIERKEIVLKQVPGVGPPGTIEGGFSVNGAPPFDMSGSIEGQGGTLVVASGIKRFYMTRPGSLAYCVFACGIAPQGLEAVFDVRKNGTSVWFNPIDRPTITPGANVSLNVVPDDDVFIAGDYYTVDVVQIGTVAAGGACAFSIWYF